MPFNKYEGNSFDCEFEHEVLYDDGFDLMMVRYVSKDDPNLGFWPTRDNPGGGVAVSAPEFGPDAWMTRIGNDSLSPTRVWMYIWTTANGPMSFVVQASPYDGTSFPTDEAVAGVARAVYAG